MTTRHATPVVAGEFGPTRPTRFFELSYQHRIDHWRLVTREGRGVGPLYASADELLADVERMATVYGLR